MFSEYQLCVRLRAGPFRWAGRGQRQGPRAGLGVGQGSRQSRANPLESCYCLRSLLREGLSKKSLLEKARLETSRSQRASEPCEMT